MQAVSLLMMLLLIAPPMTAAADSGRRLRITAAVANVRSAPSAESKVVFQLRTGDLVRILESSEQWYGIEAGDGRRGYVFHRLGDVVEPPPPVPAPEPAAQAPSAPAAPSGTGVASLAIQHDQIGCVVAGLYPKIDACLVPADSLGRAEIHFRANDSEPWYGTGLAADGPCHSAFLPKPQRTTSEFQYYVTALDRSFAEHLKPEAGPTAPFHVRVVQRDRDCGTVARLAHSAGKVVKPILVAVVRDPAGRALAAGAMQVALLAGFAQEGVILAGAAAAAGAGSAAGATAASAGGGGGGGIGTTTIAIAGGAVAAAAVVAKAAGGGGGGSKSSTPSSGGSGGGGGTTPTPTPTPTPATNLTGNWSGTDIGTGNVTGPDLDVTVNCTTTLTGPLQHTGNTLTGRLTQGRWTCNPADGNEFLPAAGTVAEITGTTTPGGQLTISAPSVAGCGTVQLTGTYASSTIDFTGSIQCTVQGAKVTGTEVVHLQRQ
jgi:hypothetical protein